MTYIVYHDDLDGQCAAAIAIRAGGDLQEARLIPANYTSPIDWINGVTSSDIVYVLDFSLSLGDFLNLAQNVLPQGALVWIDHHKTAIEGARGTALDDVAGIRDTSAAGCVLTWRYFYGDKRPPRAVTLVGDRDIWAWKEGIDSAKFHAGAQLEDTSPRSHFWTEKLEGRLSYVLSDGQMMLRYQGQRNKGLVDALAFGTTIEGHSARAVNVARQGSETFGAPGWETGALPGDVDICCTFYWTGRTWTISLYSDPKRVDVSEIAKKFGGGGHPGASGFQSVEMPSFLKAKA